MSLGTKPGTRTSYPPRRGSTPVDAKKLMDTLLGTPNRPGHYGFSQISFHHVEGYRFPLYYQNTLLMTHEFGHNFNGVHAEADEWCVTNFIWCWDYVRTVMWDTLYDDNVDELSNGSRNSSHNNLDRIRTNWKAGLVPVMVQP